MALAVSARMTRLTLHGTPVYTEGAIPRAGDTAPPCRLTTGALLDIDLTQLAVGPKVLHLIPSVELPLFDQAARRLAATLVRATGLRVFTVSADLPFSLTRLDPGLRGDVLSCFRSHGFARRWGLEIVSGPLRGLLAPAVFVLDGEQRIVHAGWSREMAEAPDVAAIVQAATSVASTPVASVA